MPLAIDASTPALTEADNTCTTASFTAPVDSLLVALCMCNTGSGATNTVSNTGGALTWTQRINRQAGEDVGAYTTTVKVFTAPAVSSVARTVTLTTSGTGYTALKVLVITGADLANPVGSTGEGSSATVNLTPTVYTSTVADSRAVGIAGDAARFEAPTTSDVGFAFGSFPSPSGIAVYKAADTSTPSSSVTLNFDGSSAATRNWNWVAAEILPVTPPPLRRGIMLGQAIHRAAFI